MSPPLLLFPLRWWRDSLNMNRVICRHCGARHWRGTFRLLDGCGSCYAGHASVLARVLVCNWRAMRGRHG